LHFLPNLLRGRLHVPETLSLARAHWQGQLAQN
jgi:hypothetical protein